MPAATIEQAREMARDLERRERGRSGSADAARSVMARRIGVAPSTWKNLTLGRLKRIDAWMRDRLELLVVRELETEIRRLTHELEIARQSGAHPDSDQVCEVEAHLLAARLILSDDTATTD